MAKPYEIVIRLDDADAERKLKALAGLFGNVDRAARTFADKASRGFKEAAAGAAGLDGKAVKSAKAVQDVGAAAAGMGKATAAGMTKAAQTVQILGAELRATHVAFAGLSGDARAFGAAFVQTVNTQVIPAAARMNQAVAGAHAGGGAPLSDARARAWQRQLDVMSPRDRAAFDAENAARAKARDSAPDYKAASDAVRAQYYARRNGAGGDGGNGAVVAAHKEEADEKQKIDVGYYKVVADNINKQIKDEKAAAVEKVRANKKAADDKVKINQIADAHLARQATKDYREKQAEEDRFQARFVKGLTDREVKQVVSNERIARSNDKRVQAAMRAAGLEDKGHQQVLKSLGMMVARFATYHLLIGQASKLWGDMAAAIHKAVEEQARLMGMFTEDRAANRKIAAQVGVANDDAFQAQIAGVAARTGIPLPEVRQFLTAALAGGAGRIGNQERDFQELGATVTPQQFMKFAEGAIAFGGARGMDLNAMGAMAAETLGIKDVHKMGEAGTDQALANLAVPFKIMERFKGKDAALAESFSEFHAANKQQFNGPEQEAAFLSMMGEAKPGGRVFAPGQAVLTQLETPNKKTLELLNRVVDENGKRLMKKGADGDMEFSEPMKAQDKILAINKWMDRQGWSELQRSQEIAGAFGMRTGLAGAKQVFGANWKEELGKRLAFGDEAKANLVRDQNQKMGGDDMKLAVAQQETEAAKLARGAELAPAALPIEQARGAIAASGINENAAFGVLKAAARVISLGTLDVDAHLEKQVAKQFLHDDIAARDPSQQSRGIFGLGKDLMPWSFNILGDLFGDRNKEIVGLVKEKDRLNGVGGAAAGQGGGAAGIVAAINQGNDKVVAAINALNQKGQGRPQAAAVAVPQGQAPDQNGGGGGFFDLLGKMIF